ncbi:MAG: hypothetical protein EKK55_02175 [Rhodocyclaceae bacterium]|nr:MAG: hypothetical protein EKK55_02175 [Rhodocyclaceae bacterium]
MSLGALTVIEKADSSVSQNQVAFTLVGDGAYPAGGTPGFEAFVQEKLGKTLTLVAAHGMSLGAVAILAWYDFVNDKLCLRNLTDGADATPGSFAAETFQIVATYK